MIIDYQRSAKRRIRPVRFIMLLLFAAAVSCALPAYRAIRPMIDRIRMLHAQTECLQYDGKNTIVYAATRRLIVRQPFEVVQYFDPVDTDLVEKIRVTYPACWADFKAFDPGVSTPTDIWSFKPPSGVFLALHDRVAGSQHYLFLLYFNRDFYEHLQVQFYKPATYSNPRVTSFQAPESNDRWRCDPNFKLDEPLKKFVLNTWESIVIHSAVMDPVDESHFTIDMVVDSKPTTCDCYLELEEYDNLPRLYIKSRIAE